MTGEITPGGRFSIPSGVQRATTTLEDTLRRVWYAAVDANNSPDFRDADGELNEDAYLRYQENVIRRAIGEIQGGSS